MKKKSLDKIINLIREEGPVMSMGNGGIAGSPESGDDPPVFTKKKKRKPTPVGRYGTRRTWRQQSGQG